MNKKTKEISQSHDFLAFFKELLGYKSLNDQNSTKQYGVYHELHGIDYALGELSAFADIAEALAVPFHH